MKLQFSINFKINNFYINTKTTNWRMLSWCKVFFRILALLQRKPLIETKNHTLKCLKRHYSTVQSMKNVAVLTEDRAYALFFRSHARGFDSSRVSTPGNLLDQGKKIANTRGQGVLGPAGFEQLGPEMFSIEYSGVKLKFTVYIYFFSFSEQGFRGNYSTLVSHKNTVISQTISSRWLPKP